MGSKSTISGPGVPENNFHYQRHRPEETLLYKVICENVATVFEQREARGKTLPKYVRQEFDAFLECGILAKGFLRLRCDSCGTEKLVAFSCKKRGFCPSCGGRRMADTAAHLVDNVFPERPVRQWVLSFPYNLRYLFAYHAKALSQALQIMIRVIHRYYVHKQPAVQNAKTGAVMLIQRFGGSVNLNPHFHVLFLDGVFGEDGSWSGVSAPTDQEVAKVVKKIRLRVFKALEKKGYISGHNVNFDSDELYNRDGGLAELMLGSIQGVNCFGDDRGKKVNMMGKMGSGSWAELKGNRCAYQDGFSLHANVSIAASDRLGLERLCRYIARPPISNERLTQDDNGNIFYRLKKPWNDGSTHVKFTPEELIGRIISLVPPPKINLIRFFGVLAPNSKQRSKIVPAKKVVKDQEKKYKRYQIEWAKLLKRVFLLEVTNCKCGGVLKIVAAITEASAISAILNHLSLPADAPIPHPARAPPQIDLF